MDQELCYDGSFIGYLSLVFEIYKSKLDPIKIHTPSRATHLFRKTDIVPVPDENHAQRVAKGIIEKGGKRAARFIYKCFLSEKVDVEIKLLYLIREIFAGRPSKISDYSDDIIMDLHKIEKMMNREVHRMHAFVRFQETKDDIWSAQIQPDFNVLPLIGKHFKDRYPAQSWLIYDLTRNYGIYYEIDKDIQFVYFNDHDKRGNIINAMAITDDEIAYQSLWKQYFKSVNIPERNNPKLHLQHVPRRYWKYLIEK